MAMEGYDILFVGTGSVQGPISGDGLDQQSKHHATAPAKGTQVPALRPSAAVRLPPIPNPSLSANHGVLSFCLNTRPRGKLRQKKQLTRARAKQPPSLTRKDRRRAIVVFTRVVARCIPNPQILPCCGFDCRCSKLSKLAPPPAPT